MALECPLHPVTPYFGDFFHIVKINGIFFLSFLVRARRVQKYKSPMPHFRVIQIIKISVQENMKYTFFHINFLREGGQGQKYFHS